MDRLLSEQDGLLEPDKRCEICKEIGGNYDCTPLHYIEGCHVTEAIKAQRTKTDKEWVEWGDSKCTATGHGDYMQLKRCCPICWQERKKEIQC